jgi:diguanylate cyclase (GGDEF)-like protein
LKFRRLFILISPVFLLPSIYFLPVTRLDIGFLLLALMTAAVSARVAIRIPHTNGSITVSDTLVFLTLIIYGGEAAVLLGVLDGVCSSLHISRKPLTIIFNGALMGFSTFITAWVLRFCLGAAAEGLHEGSSAMLVTGVCIMALVQYAVNSGLVAFDKTLRLRQPFRQVWVRYYLWTSLTYFAGASAASVVAKLMVNVGFFPVVVTTPIIAILYFTYQTYLKSIETSAAQAAQAERHVEELNHYIAEQDSTRQELQKSREHFRKAALHDPLTGLPNRTLLVSHLEAAIERARTCDDYLFAVLFLDLDRFKVINDSLGHMVGDQLLEEIARRLERCVRQVDVVARLGGDEFAILLSRIEGYGEAARVAERIHDELARPFQLKGHEVYSTASIGITLSSIGYQEPEDILRDADTVMYRAKANGKARHELFDEAMHARAVELLRLETDLRRAVGRQEFLVHYQPVISLEEGNVSGLEVLVRWQHPERGIIPPGEFIPAAEETGLIVDIGHAVLREACSQMRRWQLEGLVGGERTMSVNLSGRQFNQPDLVKFIEQVLRETQLDPRCLMLEITESVVMEHAEAACVTLTHLRSLGIGLSIDDFGTGYSSLSYLHRFPVNTLKVDRSFIGRMTEGGENSEIVRTIITLGSNLGMGVVAEGVETESQSAQLKQMGCGYGQGYLYAKPMDAGTATAWLIKKRQGRAAA